MGATTFCCRTGNTTNCCGGNVFSTEREKDIRMHPKMSKEPKKLKSYVMCSKD